MEKDIGSIIHHLKTQIAITWCGKKLIYQEIGKMCNFSQQK